MLDQVLETLRTNNRINPGLLDAIDDEGLACTLCRRGGRDVLRQLGHIHDVRGRKLESQAKQLEISLERFSAREPRSPGFASARPL